MPALQVHLVALSELVSCFCEPLSSCYPQVINGLDVIQHWKIILHRFLAATCVPIISMSSEPAGIGMINFLILDVVSDS